MPDHAYYEANKDRLKKYASDYWHSHPERQAKSAERNLRKYHAIQKHDPAFMEEKRRKNLEYMAQLRLRPERREAQCRSVQKSRLKDVVPFLVRGAKARAAKKRLPFDLTIQWARTIYTGRCSLTGLEFKIYTGSQGSFSPSLDRIDPALGYTQRNCRFILAALNLMKLNGRDEEMLLIARALVSSCGG